MIQRITLSLICFFCSIAVTFSQVQIIAPDAAGATGTSQTFAITGNNLVNIASLQFSVSYDASIIDVTAVNVHPALQGLANASNPSPGVINFSWVPPGGGQSLADGDTLITVDVDVLGNQGDLSPLDLYNLEATDVPNFPDPIPVVGMDGSFTVDNSSIANPILTAFLNDAECDDDDYVVSILVDGFDGLNSLQFTLEWDPAVIDFQFFDNLANLPDLDNSEFGDFTDQGKLTFAWFNGANSLPDGSVLFDVHFDVIGAVGDDSGVDFVMNPTPIRASVPISIEVPVTTNDGVGVVIDTEPPVITCPADLTIENILGEPCKVVNNIAPLSVTDNCGPVDVTYELTGATTGSGDDDASGTCFNIGDTEVTYTATDADGNTASCSLNIHVNDTLTITAVAEDPQCGDDDYIIDFVVDNFTSLKGLQFTLVWDASVIELLETIDNAPPGPIGFGVISPDTLTMSWFDITDQGVTLPDGYVFFSLKFNVLGDVGDNTPVCYIDKPTPIEASLNGGIPPFEVPIRLRKASLTVVDTEAPVPPTAPADVTVQCATDVPDPVQLTAEDQCDGPITVSPEDEVIPGDCANNFTVIRTWTFTDAQGNSSSISQTITVDDTTAPAAPTPPADVRVQCADDVPAPVQLTAQDNCDGAITASPTAQITPGNCANDFVMVRTWTFTDQCGNTSSVSQTITVDDDTAPVITGVPADVTVDCDAIPAPATSVSATDNCDASVQVVFAVTRKNLNSSLSGANEVPPNNSTATGSASGYYDYNTNVLTITVEFSGLEGTTTNVGPFSAGHIHNAPAGANGPVIFDLGIAAGQQSGSVTTSFNLTNAQEDELEAGNYYINIHTDQYPAGEIRGQISVQCPNEFIMCRTWSATDSCGNAASQTQLITVIDTTAPSFLFPLPQDTTVECDNVPPFFQPTANDVSDNCSPADSIQIGIASSIVPGDCANEYTLTRSWFITDECGNTNSHTQTIHVIDTTAPEILIPAPQDITVECDNIPPFDVPDNTEVSDNCSPADSIMITAISGISQGACLNEFQIARSFTITDECGNSATFGQTVTVIDTTAPVLTVTPPQDVTVECDDVPDAPVFTADDVSDNCAPADSIDITAASSITPGDCPDNYTITRTWTLTDPCGNSTTYTQVVTVQDTEAPTANCNDITIELDANGNASIVVGDVTSNIADNCGEVSSSLSQSSFTCDDLGANSVTVTLTDDCGNTFTCTVTVTVEDNIPPTALCQDITVNLDAQGNVTITPGQVDDGSTDNCTITSLTLDQTNFTCADLGPNTVTLTVTDQSDNSATCTAVVTVQDVTPPNAVCQDITVFVGQDGTVSIDPQDVDGGSTDNCTITGYDVSRDEFECLDIGSPVTVTLTVTDQSGNSATCDAEVTVLDTVAPILNCPADMTVNLDPGACDARLSFNISATDNCEGMLTTNFLGTTFIDNNSQDGNMFDVTNVSGGPLTINSFDVHLNAGTNTTVEVYYTTTANTFVGNETNPGAWTLLGSAPVMGVGNGLPTPLPVGGLTLAPGETKGLYVTINNAALTMPYTNGANVYNNGELQIETGVGKSYPFGFTFTPRTWNGNIFYTVGVCDSVLIEKTDNTGLESGDFFPIGVHTLSYKATDCYGNMSTCSFTFDVREFPDPIPSLACNDTVIIALNPNDCMEEIGADLVLEGGPYGCYDDYIIEIFENGVNTGNKVDGDDIGKTLIVRVTDPETGNFCETVLIVVDNSPPTILCSDVTVQCNESTEPEDVIGYSVTDTFEFVGPSPVIPDGCPNGAGLEVPITVSGVGSVTDLNLSVFIQHTWVGDMAAELESPSGTIVPIFTRVGSVDGPCEDSNTTGNFGCAADDINSTFDDEATNTAADFENLCIAGMGGTYQPEGSFSDFNGEPADGTWILRVFDGTNSNLFTGTVEEASLEISGGTVGEPLAFDACGDVALEHEDEVEDFDCDGQFDQIITRTWTATDESGNSSVCVQTIFVERISIEDLTFPPNYDDVDEPALECGDNTDPSVTGLPTGLCDNINFTFKDTEIPICEGSFKILRVFTVVDWCTQEIREVTQIIKVIDDTPPTVLCPPDVTINANNQGVANYVLPVAADKSDDCSAPGSIGIRIEGEDGTGYLEGDLVLGLPIGVHEFFYFGSDDCGNEALCNGHMVTVIDNDPPVAICDEETTVALGLDGTARVCWQTIDDGSYDNVGIVAYKLKRMDAPSSVPFTDCINFNCNDVGKTIMVRLRVYDIAGTYTENDPVGRFNECMAEVEVQDVLKPVIACPANRSLDCWEFDPEVFDGVNPTPPGTPTFVAGAFVGYFPGAVDNCGVERVDITQVIDQDNCGQGTVIRTYRALDVNGNTAQCTQFLDLSNNDPFEICDTRCWSTIFSGCAGGHDPNDGVEWPCNITLDECGPGLLPEDLEDNQNVNPNDVRPRIFEDACDLVGVTFKDTELPIVPPGCIKLIRVWTIVDWCQPDADYPLGYKTWTFNQEIKVLESAAPTITSACQDVTICGYETDCEPIPTDGELTIMGEDDCTELEDLVFKYKIDAFNDGSIDFTSDNNPLAFKTNEDNEAEGEYPIGTHRIVWVLEDGCGNFATCQYLFTVRDCLPPTPICIDEIVTVLMPVSGMVTLEAEAFEDQGFSKDNCTPFEDLFFAFEEFPACFDPNDPNDPTCPVEFTKTFTCDDLGVNSIEIWVIDEYGNQDHCEVEVEIQDPNEVCNDSIVGLSVAGLIETEYTEPVAEVTVEATSSTTSFGQQITGAAGTFEFTLPANNNYTVTPEKDINPLNGVTTFDLVLISQHILGLQPLNSPYKIIAADANNDGNVSTLDIIEIRSLILNIIPNFTSNTSWRFVDMDYVFPDPANPFTPPFPEVINYNNLDQDELETDFVGVKIGDVDGNATPSSILEGDYRSGARDMVFEVEDRELVAGEEYTVAFKADDFTKVNGFQFTLSFDQEYLEFIDISNGALPELSIDNFGFTLLQEGAIPASWIGNNVSLEDGNELFTVTFRAKLNGQLKDVLALNSRYAVAEAYLTSEERLNIALRFTGKEGSVVVGGDFELYQNQPNPFKNETVIGFFLPKETNASLKIYDLSGKLLHVISEDYSRGYHAVSINRSDLPVTGMLYYELSTPDNTATKKMLLID